MSNSRRRFLTFATGALAGVGAAFASLPFIRSLNMPKHKLAPYVDIEFPKLKEGHLTQAALLGKPIFVARRSQQQIDSLSEKSFALKDPESDESVQPDFAKNIHRSKSPEIFVAVGLCTHLGCSPSHVGTKMSPREFLPDGGYFCPCHGAVFDAAGRILKGGPAPINMEIPKHEFIKESVVRVWYE